MDVNVAMHDCVCPSIRDEAEEIRKHWHGICGATDTLHPCTDILDYVVPLDWARVVVDADSVFAPLYGARLKSAPGPDGLSYRHLLHFEAEVVSLLLSAHTHTLNAYGRVPGILVFRRLLMYSFQRLRRR
eukprot:4290549-Amphidinium_carterae.1